MDRVILCVYAFAASDREVLMKNSNVSSLKLGEAFHNQGQHTAAIEPSYLLEFTNLRERKLTPFLT
jgi:hypothetical protein